MEGKLWGGARQTHRSGRLRRGGGQAAPVHPRAPNQSPHSRDSRGDHAEVRGHGVQPQHLLPQRVQPGVDGAIGPGQRARRYLRTLLRAALPPEGAHSLAHSPQLVLVIAQADRQQGGAPQLQQPPVQLLGHKVEPVQREVAAGTGQEVREAAQPAMQEEGSGQHCTWGPGGQRGAAPHLPISQGRLASVQLPEGALLGTLEARGAQSPCPSFSPARACASSHGLALRRRTPSALTLDGQGSDAVTCCHVQPEREPSVFTWEITQSNTAPCWDTLCREDAEKNGRGYTGAGVVATGLLGLRPFAPTAHPPRRPLHCLQQADRLTNRVSIKVRQELAVLSPVSAWRWVAAALNVPWVPDLGPCRTPPTHRGTHTGAPVGRGPRAVAQLGRSPGGWGADPSPRTAPRPAAWRPTHLA